MATTGMTDQLGRVLGGRYRLTAPVGAGSSAQVYLADDVTLHRRVAVKVLHPALAADEAFLRRFRAEARAAAALSHPNLMAVYDWGEDDGPYLVLEFLGGGSLRGLLDTGVRLTISQAVVVGLDAARALDAAHRSDFVHRDIKPANLLFGDDGRLRIADFGLARALSEAAWTDPGDGLVGTARYAAPEQASGGRVGSGADVYSLALVLIEAVTGVVPLVGETALATLLGRVERPVEVSDALGPLQAILERAGRPDPAERPTAAELGRGLHLAARGLDRPGPLPLAGAVVAGAPHVDPTLLPGRRTVGPDAVVDLRAPAGDGDGPPTSSAGPRTVLFDELASGAVATAPVGSSLDGVDPDPSDADPYELDQYDAGDGRRGRGRGARARFGRWGWPVLGVVLVALLAAGGLLAVRAYQVSQPTTATVPSLATLERGEAEAELAGVEGGVDGGLDWILEVDEEHNEIVREGFVIGQEPPPGTVLEDGRTVRLVVSLGPPPRAVPDLFNRTLDEARTDIGAAELVLGATDELNVEDVEAGRIISWSVDGEDRPTEVPKGSEVDLVVSAGPARRTVPALTGSPIATARAALAELGLVATVVERFSTSVERGVVIDTAPGDGTTLERGGQVQLVVSKGRDLVVVPEVAGMSIEGAVAALRAAGLAEGDVSGPAGGKVNATDPAAGASVDRGTVVDLFLRT